MNCIINASNGIRYIGDAGNTQQIYNNVFEIQSKAIYFNGDVSSNYIEDNIIINADEEAVYFRGNSSSGGDPGNSIIKANKFFNNNYALYLKYSHWSVITYNVFENNTRGIYLQANGENLGNEIYYNNFSGNDYGIHINGHRDNSISHNHFCQSNSIYDILVSPSLAGNAGSGNRCEKPDGWNDTSSTGCAYYCDSGAEVSLLYPNDESTYLTNDEVQLVCLSEDNYKLVNVTLYHNISGLNVGMY